LFPHRQAGGQPETLDNTGGYGWWYQYHFVTARGAHGFRQHTHDFDGLVWKNASPKWTFHDATYNAAPRFNNHDDSTSWFNYRRRLASPIGPNRGRPRATNCCGARTCASLLADVPVGSVQKREDVGRLIRRMGRPSR
jgi:hypothetical protein